MVVADYVLGLCKLRFAPVLEAQTQSRKTKALRTYLDEVILGLRILPSTVNRALLPAMLLAKAIMRPQALGCLRNKGQQKHLGSENPLLRPQHQCLF